MNTILPSRTSLGFVKLPTLILKQEKKIYIPTTLKIVKIPIKLEREWVNDLKFTMWFTMHTQLHLVIKFI